MSVRASATFPAYAGTFRSDRAGNPNAGCCTLCRTSKVSAERPCVELGKNARPFREGMVVVCFNCAVSIGAAVGMLSSADAETLRTELAELGAEVARLTAEAEGFAQLQSALDVLASVSTRGG